MPTLMGLFWTKKRARRGSRRERQLQSLLSEREATLAALRQRIASLEESLKIEQSTNRIQQVEIDELTAVVARNLERVKAETHELALAASLRGAALRADLLDKPGE